jgi:predicted kinase
MWAWHPEQVSVGAAVRTSHLVDLRLLAALWACDGAGRISVDAEQIPERVAWAELCLAELTRGETVGAYPHISEVCDPQQLEARVRRDVLRGVVTGTIASAGAAAAAIAHSERHQGPAHIVWMCGPPGAGKSTWAARYAERHDAEILTVTGARRRDRDQSRGHNRARLEQLVSAGARVVVDATHVTRESRDRLCALASRYGARLDAVIFDTRSQVCIQRQRHRPSGTAVPADTIRSMVAALRWPTPDEYDTLTVVADDGTEGPWLAQHELEDQEAHP